MRDTIISAITAFIITAGGTIVAIVASNGGAALNKTAWTLAVVFGAMASAKDLRSSMRLPPIEVEAPKPPEPPAK